MTSIGDDEPDLVELLSGERSLDIHNDPARSTNIELEVEGTPIGYPALLAKVAEFAGGDLKYAQFSEEIDKDGIHTIFGQIDEYKASLEIENNDHFVVEPAVAIANALLEEVEAEFRIELLDTDGLIMSVAIKRIM